MSLLVLERTPHTAVPAVTPPNRILSVQPAGGFGDTSTPKSSPTFDVVNGDLLTLFAFSEDSTVTLGTPTWDGTGTWTLQQSVVVSSYCTAYVFTCPVTATATARTITVTQTAGLTRMWSFVAFLWRDHGGVGVSGKANITGAAPALTLPVSAGSVLACGVSDWSAADGTSRTWRTVNGAPMTEAAYFRSAANYTMYTGYSIDSAGLAGGPETVGLSTPATQTFAIVGVEVKGTIATGNAGTLAAAAPRATVAIAGTQTNPATLAATAPLPVVAIAEAGTISSTLAATAPRPVVTITGTLTNPGTLAATARAATEALTGAQTNPGVLAATAPLPVVTIAAAASSNVAVLAVTAPRPVVAIAGTQVDPGTLVAVGPAATFSAAGALTNRATLAATAPRATASISGTMTNTATLTTVVPVPVVAVSGSLTNPGVLAVDGPQLTVNITGTLTNPGVLDTAAGLPVVVLTGESFNLGVLAIAGLLPVVTWSGSTLPQVDITVTGALGRRRWAATMPARSLAGALGDRRWSAAAAERDKSGTLNPRRWKGSTS